MALVSANQFKLGLDLGQAAQTGIGAFRGAQAANQRQQQIGQQQQQLDRQAVQDEFMSVAQAAVQAQALPNDESKINFLTNRAAEISERGGNPKDTQEALDLFNAGRSEEANALINSAVDTGTRLGFLKPLAQPAGAQQFTLGAGQTRFGPGGEVIATGPEAVATPTTLERNLASAGLKKGTPEFETAVLKATTKPTTVIGAGETEEVKALAKQRVKRFGDVQEAAEGATAMLDNLNQLDAIDVQTGALEPAKVAIASVIEGFGIDASGIASATNAQAFNAISGRLVNDVLNAATGPQTDQDASRARKTIATLGDTPAAAVFKNNSLRAVANRQIEQRDFIAGQLDQDKNLSEANKEWRKFKRSTPSLSSVVKGPEGLPVFFFQFKENAKSARPGISDQDIIKAWRGAHAK